MVAEKRLKLLLQEEEEEDDAKLVGSC